jgi:predicted SprT family Zn-dependent metalloprotease
MNEETVRAVVTKISKHYRLLHEPELSWNVRSDSRFAGYADQSRNTIRFRPGHYSIDTTLHEVVHIVVYNRFRHPGDRSRPHGLVFFRELVIAARVWYGDPAHYNWNIEYASVRNRAIKFGLIPNPIQSASTLQASCHQPSQSAP